MDNPVLPHRPAVAQSRMNDVRESDIRVDPVYREKLQFFNDLNIKCRTYLNIVNLNPSAILDEQHVGKCSEGSP